MTRSTCSTIQSTFTDLFARFLSRRIVRQSSKWIWEPKLIGATRRIFRTPAGFILMDFSTGMIFDFVATGKKIGAIYERVLIPGVTDENTAFTHLIESPFVGVATSPRRLHKYSVRIDASDKKAEWFVDGKKFF